MSRTNAARGLAHRGIRRLWLPVQKWFGPRFGNGYSAGPRSILIQLTYRCDLRCSFCGQWGETGIFKKLPARELREVLPLPLSKRVIDELPLICSAVGLWGGETLAYPEIVPLVRYIKQSGRYCSLVTNGTHLARHVCALVEAGADNIVVSLDAEEATHDRLRGAPGTFQAALEGIRAVIAERSRRGVRTPCVGVTAILIPEAVQALPALIRRVRAEGVDRVYVGRLQYTTEQQGKSHEATFQKLFQTTAPSWQGFRRQPEPSSSEKVRTIVAELRADPASKDFLIWDEPFWSPQDYVHYYGNPALAVPADRACRFPWDAAGICPNGDLSPCPDFPDFVVGNIKDTPFSAIWNGPRFLEFRRRLAEQGRFPVCTSCCHLYDD